MKTQIEQNSALTEQELDTLIAYFSSRKDDHWISRKMHLSSEQINYQRERWNLCVAIRRVSLIYFDSYIKVS